MAQSYEILKAVEIYSKKPDMPSKAAV